MQKQNVSGLYLSKNATSQASYPAIAHISGPAAEINRLKPGQMQGLGISGYIYSHRWPKKHGVHPVPRQATLGQRHFLHQPGWAAEHDAAIMTVAVVAQFVACGQDRLHQFGMAPHLPAIDKKSGTQSVLCQQGQKCRCCQGIGAIIKGEADLPDIPATMADNRIKKRKAWKQRGQYAGQNK